jgi:hypothetical protein
MISKLKLEMCKQQKISDVKLEDLVDISTVVIDTTKPVPERICSYLEQIGNPYLFKIGNTPVKVSFTPEALSFQKSLEKLLTKNI